MDNEPNILFLAFWTPPVIRPRAIASGKIISEMLRQGVSPAVVTYDICGDWQVNTPLYKVPTESKSRLSRLPFLKAVFERQYYRRIIRVAETALKKHRCNVIFSFANPQQSNMLGALLKKKFGIPFISHFSDPWYDNPYYSFKPREGRKILKRETFIVEQSDRVVFTNPEARALVMRKYPAAWQQKARVMPHAFDPREYPPERTLETERFVFSHVGAFYEQRKPEPFFRALAIVFTRRPELKDRSLIRVVGSTDVYTGYTGQALRELAARYGLAERLSIIPQVTYRESLAHMREADCLFIVDADFSGSPFLPSKVIDYAGSGQPIIGITPAGSPTATVLAGLGYPAFAHHDVEALALTLEGMLAGTLRLEPNQEFLQQFRIDKAAGRLLDEFRAVLKGRV